MLISILIFIWIVQLIGAVALGVYTGSHLWPMSRSVPLIIGYVFVLWLLQLVFIWA